MRQVFQDAARVIVLDASIRERSAQDELQNLAWTIAASPWMQRLWTYQEAYIGQFLLIECADGLRDVDELLRFASQTMQEHQFEYLRLLGLRNLLVPLRDIRPGLREASRKDIHLAYVMHSVQTRSTSHPDDELLTVSGIANVDVNEVIELTGEARIVKFYQLARQVSWLILFLTKERVSVAPFRWIPRTMLGWTNDTMVVSVSRQPNAVCTKYGLEVELEVLPLDTCLDFTTDIHVLVSVGGDILELYRRPDAVPALDTKKHVDVILVFYTDVSRTTVDYST